jgi:transcriptional regulator with XRE-family HTH domain
MDNNIYNRLKSARTYLNLSQEYVAKHLGIPRTAISAIETGQRNISTNELKIFSELYGLTCDQIVHGEDDNQEIKIFARLYADLPETDKLEIQNLIEFKKNLREQNGAIR